LFLNALGCEAAEVNTNTDLPFPHGPEPVAGNLDELCRLVRSSGADVGFAQDSDGDRLAILNERGEVIGEDCTVAMAVYQRLRHFPGPVVINVSTSRMIDDVAGRRGCPVYRTPVGEIHVVERMLECGSPVGGEGNGGVIVPAINPCRDSFVGMALVLEALAEEGCSISELRGKIPTYAMVRENLCCPARDMAPSLRLLADFYRGEHLDLTDGVKVLWADRWLHARPSNTEPILRLIAEAPTEPQANMMLLQALDCLGA
jgi:phosphomannomutase